MTVKELREKLNEFPDGCIVMMRTIDYVVHDNDEISYFPYIPVMDVYKGVNEADCGVFIDSYVEDEKCRSVGGMKYD